MESEDIPVSLVTASSAAEALQQRLELYKVFGHIVYIYFLILLHYIFKCV